MIARIWHGRTTAADYQKYTDFLRAVAIPDYQGTDGFVRLTFLRRLAGEVAHFTLITYWANLEAIAAFAGSDIERAKYYPEDTDFLLEFEERVTHNEVFADVAN